MKKRNVKLTHNDGWVSLIQATKRRNEVGRVVGETHETVSRHPISYMTVRTKDVDFYQAQGSTLDLKIRTPYHKSLETSHPTACKIQHFNKNYDIINIDIDYTNKLMYLYLGRTGGVLHD